MTALAFGTPAVLWALLLLPVLWWLLRATPPRPRDVTFAPTRLLLSLMKREETATRTPWWLMLIRLALAAVVILALAQPVLRPEAPAPIGEGPLLLAVDDSFGAAADWQDRLTTAGRLIDEAEVADRTVILVATSDADAPLTASSAAEARDRLGGIEPHPWSPRRAELAPRLAGLSAGGAAWIADGLATEGDAAFYTALDAASAAPVRIVLPEPGGILGVSAVENADDGFAVTLTADADPGPIAREVQAIDAKGFVLASGRATFESGATTATADLALPTELRNDALRIAVAGARSAAAVRLLDDSFRRRTVGLISGTSVDVADQPLLSPLHYLRAALGPFADVREPTAQDLPSAIAELIDAGTSVIVLADVGTLLPDTQDVLARWINAGGVLIRFAGPRTAGGMDDLVPVAMREGARTLGGTLSWEEPQPLAEFARSGPFAEMAVPKDVVVTRQVLADPSLALAERTWAALADGTPFVTGRNIGQGWVTFVHVTADPSWSNFPLSSGYIEMLRALVQLSTARTGTAAAERALPPYRVLDGVGRLIAPGPRVEPLAGNPPPGPASPPGLYGSDGAFRAVNLLRDGERLASLDPTGFAGAAVERYKAEGPTDLKGALLTMAAVLLLVDCLAILALMGAFRRSAVAAVALAVSVLPLLAPPPAAAQSEGLTRAQIDFAMEAANETRLAYVATGSADIDAVSEAGLRGLSAELTRRTAIEPSDPIAVNVETDDLAFFPLIYWPIGAAAARPSDHAIAKVDAFMKNGGTILFDTRDQAQSAISGTTSPATMALRRILDGLDIPALEPVPTDHVLTKTFYLLDGFPGRWAGGPLWVEALPDGPVQNRPARAGDGVSPILITSNDLAGAWAVGTDGTYLFPTVPNDPFQREIAFRAGINIVMYTMTGNYKADQVHVPALLERLGQ
jgi:hypothetical protein